MRSKLDGLALATGMLGLAGLLSLTYGQDARDELTLAERVMRLERELAGLETRFEARTLESPGAEGRARGLPLDARVTTLESRVDALSSDLGRVERQATAALRQAERARREAMAAERIARQAATRRP